MSLDEVIEEYRQVVEEKIAEAEASARDSFLTCEKRLTSNLPKDNFSV